MKLSLLVLLPFALANPLATPNTNTLSKRDIWCRIAGRDQPCNWAPGSGGGKRTTVTQKMKFGVNCWCPQEYGWGWVPGWGCYISRVPLLCEGMPRLQTMGTKKLTER